MDALQTRFRDKASEMLQKTPTIALALGHGSTFSIETCYVVGNSDELHCIVKPNPAIVEAVQDDARVAFTVNQGFPTQMLQGVGRAFFLGGLDLHPHLRDQILAKSPDANAFLSTIRNLGVMRVLPDLIAITDDANLGLGPRPVYIPEAAKALPGQRRRWIEALGMASWPLVLIPVFVAALLAGRMGRDTTWWLLIPVYLVAILVHTGTILLATYTGFHRHIDRTAALGANRLLQDGLLSTRQVFEAALLCLALGSVLGLFLVGLRGTSLLVIGVIGTVGGLLYAGWPMFLPYRALEDVVVFVGLGPLLVLGAFEALTGSLHGVPFLVSMTLGCLAASILHARHLQMFAVDNDAKVHTLAVELGWPRARLLFYALVGIPYVLGALLILVGVLPPWAWLTFISLPLVGRSALSVSRATTGGAPELAGLDRQMAQAYLVFGVLLMFSLILG